MWLDAFPEDFRDPPNYPLLNQLLAFCEEHAKDSELHFKVKHRYDRLLKNPELSRPINHNQLLVDRVLLMLLSPPVQMTNRLASNES